jgi:hypothetical protein
VLEKRSVTEINTMFTGRSKVKKLEAIAVELEKVTEDEDLKLLEFLKGEGNSSLTQSISSNVSAANRVLEKLTQNYISSVCN